MEQSSLQQTVRKFALFGQQAGFSVEEMIQLPEAGVSVDALLWMIAARLDVPMPRRSRWVK